MSYGQTFLLRSAFSSWSCPGNFNMAMKSATVSKNVMIYKNSHHHQRTHIHSDTNNQSLFHSRSPARCRRARGFPGHGRQQPPAWCFSIDVKPSESQKMLIRKDGISVSIYEMQALFKNVSEILDEISADPSNYEPLDLKSVEDMIANIRQIRLEYAPAQLKFISSNFMIWFHQFQAQQMSKKLKTMQMKFYASGAGNNQSSSQSQAYQAYHRQIIEWNAFLSSDMEIVWNLLSNIDVKILSKDMEIDDEEDMLKIVRNLRVNTSLYLYNYQYLKDSVEDIIIFNKNIKFLENDELLLALTASPFIGNFDLMMQLIDRLYYDEYKYKFEMNRNQTQAQPQKSPARTESPQTQTQTQKSTAKANPKAPSQKLLEMPEYLNTLQLPTGINYYELYSMCSKQPSQESQHNSNNTGIDGSNDHEYGEIIDEWQNKYLLSLNETQLKSKSKKDRHHQQNKTTMIKKDIKNVYTDVTSDLAWYKISEFELFVKDVTIDPLYPDKESLKEKYTSAEFLDNYARTVKTNTLVRKMGCTAQIITMLGVSNQQNTDAHASKHVDGSSIGGATASDSGSDSESSAKPTPKPTASAKNDCMFLDELPMHLHGFWLYKLSEMDFDQILVNGKTTLPLNDGKMSLIINEKWKLFEQYCDSQKIYLYGQCFTEQKIVACDGRIIQLDNSPSFVRMRSDCKMTLMRE